MKKSFKKSSVIAIFSLIVLLTSCDPYLEETHKVKNNLDKEIKAYAIIEHQYDSIITIAPGETQTVYYYEGLGVSQFYKGNDNDFLHHDSYVIFDDSIKYMPNYEAYEKFEKSFGNKSCWEIISNESKGCFEVLYTITEEDYQNALILNGINN